MSTRLECILFQVTSVRINKTRVSLHVPASDDCVKHMLCWRARCTAMRLDCRRLLPQVSTMVLSARLMFSQATPYISNVDHALRVCVRGGASRYYAPMLLYMVLKGGGFLCAYFRHLHFSNFV